jgi:single-stranded DNA-specific DHH superfamily exonuclease
MSSYEKSDKEMISCSFRSKKLNVPDVLNKCLKGLNGRGGGHPGSGGCSISRKDFEIFLKRIKSLFN